jgi:hypothetical protein
MKTGDILGKLMAFIYDEYNENRVFKAHGEYASIILKRFIRSYQIEYKDIGDIRAQMEYIRLLRKTGYIEVVSIDGSSNPKSTLYTYSRIKPTPEGVQHVENKRNPGKAIMKAAPDIAEIAGRSVKGFLGR